MNELKCEDKLGNWMQKPCSKKQCPKEFRKLAEAGE
jgi:hypothetical protein